MTKLTQGLVEKQLREVAERVLRDSDSVNEYLVGLAEKALDLPKTQAERQAEAADAGMSILDSLVGMLSGMAIQDGMPPQAVTLYKNAAVVLKAYRQAGLK